MGGVNYIQSIIAIMVGTITIATFLAGVLAYGFNWLNKKQDDRFANLMDDKIDKHLAHDHINITNSIIVTEKDIKEVKKDVNTIKSNLVKRDQKIAFNHLLGRVEHVELKIESGIAINGNDIVNLNDAIQEFERVGLSSTLSENAKKLLQQIKEK